MNLGLFNDLIITTTEKFVEIFIDELSNYLDKQNREGRVELRKEGVLYQVVDRSLNGVYLQNMESKKVYEEKNMPKEVLNKISNDYILRYKNGKYVIEEKLTDQFFENL